MSKTITKNTIYKTDKHTCNISITDTMIKIRPDDVIYKKSRKFWRDIPTGCADIKILTNKNELVWQGKLRGFPKFGYIEDKCYEFDYKDEDIDYYAFQTKENGECFHFTCSPIIQSERVFVFGSKNIHVAVIMPPDDFWKKDWLQPCRQAMYSEERYEYPFQLVQQMIKEIRSKVQIQKSWDFFLSIIENHTAIAEACDSVRREDFVVYETPRLVWLGWRCEDCGVLCARESFLSKSPKQQRNTFISCGWDVPEYYIEVMKNEGLYTQMIQRLEAAKDFFRNAKNCEGAVKYVVLKDGSTGAFIKYKSYSYIVSRIIREKVKQGVSSSVLLKRINELHVPYTLEFERESIFFNAWVQIQRLAGIITEEEIDNRYMTIMKKYNETTTETRVNAVNQWDSITSIRKVIIIVEAPCQGCGKTRFCITLSKALSSLGKNVVRISQDDCDSFKKDFLQQIKNGIEKFDIIIIDSEDTHAYDQFKGNKVFVGFHHPEGNDKLLKLCSSRIQARSDGHVSFYPKDVPEIGIMESKWTFPTDEDKASEYNPCLSMSVLDSTEEQVLTCCHALVKVHLLDYIPDIISITDGVKEYEFYEQEIKKGKSVDRPILYWKVELDSEVIRKLCENIGIKLPLQHSFHVRLVYKPDKKTNEDFMARDGEEIEIQCSGVAHDDKCWVLCTEIEEYRQKVFYAILALEDGIMPMYAETIMNGGLATIIEFPKPMKLIGTICKVYMV